MNIDPECFYPVVNVFTLRHPRPAQYHPAQTAGLRRGGKKIAIPPGFR